MSQSLLNYELHSCGTVLWAEFDPARHPYGLKRATPLVVDKVPQCCRCSPLPEWSAEDQARAVLAMEEVQQMIRDEWHEGA